MRWTAEVKDGITVHLDSYQLLNKLMSKLPEALDKKDHVYLGEALTRFLEDRGSLPNMTIQQLIQVGFGLGYYYRVFLEKNNVTQEDENVPE